MAQGKQHSTGGQQTKTSNPTISRHKYQTGQWQVWELASTFSCNSTNTSPVPPFFLFPSQLVHFSGGHPSEHHYHNDRSIQSFQVQKIVPLVYLMNYGNRIAATRSRQGSFNLISLFFFGPKMQGLKITLQS
jgi:hypothetical protein